MKYIITVLVASLFFGCSNSLPPKAEFRINTQNSSKTFDEVGCKDKSLKVAQAFSSKALISQDMNYALGDSKQYVYSESLWAIAPNRAITSELLKLIRDSKLFKNVQISKSRSRNDFILETNIEDFMQYFNDESSSSFVNVVISLSLIDSKTNAVIASETFRQKVDVEMLNADGGVNGLNTALSNVLSQSNIWLAKVCQ